MYHNIHNHIQLQLAFYKIIATKINRNILIFVRHLCFIIVSHCLKTQDLKLGQVLQTQLFLETRNAQN